MSWRVDTFRMNHKGIRLSFRHQAWVYSVLGVLFLSGLAWMIVHYGMARTENEIPLPHPSEPLWLKIHGAAAMVTLLILGTLIPIHIKRAWAMRKNRLTGFIFTSLMAVLVLTGYGLYYSGSETLREWTSWSHMILGCLGPLFLAWHVIIGKKEAAGPKK